MDPLSDHNPLVKQIRRAISHGTLTEDGYAVAEGPHLVEEALAAHCEIRAVILSESARPALVSSLAGDAARLPAPRLVSAKTFRSISSTDTPQGVLALVKPPAADALQVFGGDALAVILDGVQDPGNAGAIVRVAEAFGSTGAVFLKGSVDPFHPRSVRGSAGSAFRLPIVTGGAFDTLIARDPELAVYAAMPRAAASIELGEADFTRACAIVIGGEGRGVSEEIAAAAIPVHIPTARVESLNAAVAAGIVLYEARRQRNAGGLDSRSKAARGKASR
jgi:RNA methyltransferase, TrmH family